MLKFIEQPPVLYRLLFPEAVWRVKRKHRKVVYLTFDDGPIEEVTPWVLDLLDHYGIKATFFLVGDNVRRNPRLFEEIKRRGHSWGNHSMNHLQGLKVNRRHYLRNIMEADKLLDTPLYRPPHGLLRYGQARTIRHHFNIIMYDLVTRDYSRNLTGPEVVDIVKRFARNGSIIVFHDSLKAERNIRYALPRAIEWLLSQGYEFAPIEM